MEASTKYLEVHLTVSRKLSRSEITSRLIRIDEILPELRSLQSPCTLCPRCCSSLRQESELGECGLSSRLRVASVAMHNGEEPPISGSKGSINVFFTGCNLHCIHCQNWPISQGNVGTDLTPDDLAAKILRKARRGAQSLGWVTPTPQIVPALEAYQCCLQAGLDLPLVHNNGGYEDPHIIHLLSGIVDIWLPDAKTQDNNWAESINSIPDYPQYNLAAIAEMVNQVERNQARAVIVRHLVLPGNLLDSKKLLQKLWESFGSTIYLSLMVQYFPFYKTLEHPQLNRRLTTIEYDEITAFARQLGFKKGWVQHYDLETGISPRCLS